MQGADLKAIARPDDRRRTVLLDDRRARIRKSGLQRIAVENFCLKPATRATDIHQARLSELRMRGRSRQARDIRLLQPREGGKMERLELGWRLRVGVTVSPLVIPFERCADRSAVLQSRNRNLNVVSLAPITHLRVVFEKNIAATELGRER